MKEFSDRCQAAAKSLQGYINCTDPAPDEDTMLTLIETIERLSVALSKYHRTVLQARRTMSNQSVNGSGTVTPNANGNNYSTNANDGHTNGSTVSNGNNSVDRSGAAQSPVSPVSTAVSDPGNRTHQTISSIDSSILRPGNNNLSGVQTHGSDDPEADHDAKPAGSYSTSTAPKLPTLWPTRYEYDPDEFNVQNPFADPDEQDEHAHGRPHGDAHEQEMRT
jgi:hypothetical protein